MVISHKAEKRFDIILPIENFRLSHFARNRSIENSIPATSRFRIGPLREILLGC